MVPVSARDTGREGCWLPPSWHCPGQCAKFWQELPSTTDHWEEAEDPVFHPSHTASSPASLGKSPNCLPNLQNGSFVPEYLPQNRWERTQSTHLLCQLSSSFLHSYFCFFSLSLSFFLPSICQKSLKMKSPTHRNQTLHTEQEAGRMWKSNKDMRISNGPYACQGHCFMLPLITCHPHPKMGLIFFKQLLLAQGLCKAFLTSLNYSS